MTKLYTLPLLLLFFAGCKKEDTPTAQTREAQLAKIWRVDDSYYTFNNKSVTVYNQNGPKTNNVGDLSDFRLQFNADKTFKHVDDGGTTTGTWELMGNVLKLTDPAVLKSDDFTVDRIDATHLDITQQIPASSLSKSQITYLNYQYEVDASKGYSFSLKLVPN